jgi:hypothetical protein
MKSVCALMLGLFMSACATHRAPVVRCDGSLVPINSGASIAATPVAEVVPDASGNTHGE